MIRNCTDVDIAAIAAIINEAAQAYRGVIPTDCWHEPYMPQSDLMDEIAAEVAFWGWVKFITLKLWAPSPAVRVQTGYPVRRMSATNNGQRAVRGLNC